MNIAAVLVVKSTGGLEEFYVSMAVRCLVGNVKYLYVQNQGCDDDTIGEILRYSNGLDLVIENIENDLPRFDLRYNEPYFRSLSIERCEKVFNPTWILQIDADEIFTKEFFSQINNLNRLGKLDRCNGCFYPSDRFITPKWNSRFSDDMRDDVNGGPKLVDPHHKFWRASIKSRYSNNPTLNHNFHGVMSPSPHPMVTLQGICNVHIHRMFGPKAFKFWAEGGDKFENTIPFDPSKMAPVWFNHKVNMGSAVYEPYDWPDFVMEKWKSWGFADIGEKYAI